MNMDKLFRTVFNNIVIRNKIFNSIRENNKFIGSQKNLVFRKYNQCNIKWCVLNKQFNLLVYKLSKQLNKRNQFKNDHFHFFLEHNTELELLKQIFQIFPNLIPTTIKEQTIIIEKCSLGSSTLNISIDDEYIEKNNFYNFKNKHSIIEYLMKELKIKPTKQTLYNLCIDGYNITIIKSLFDQGYFSIMEDCDIGLVFCSLKAKDLSFYKLILENNPTLKNELQNMNNQILNQLLVSTCNVEFYKYSFDELLKDGDKINNINNSIPVTHPFNNDEPKLFNINQIAIKLCNGNFEIIEYLCNNYHMYPKSHVSNFFIKTLRTITHLNEESKDGISSLELLKFFLNNQKINFKIYIQTELESITLSFMKNDKLDCLTYLKQEGYELPINGYFIYQALIHYKRPKEHIFLDWVINYIGNSHINCTEFEFSVILKLSPKNKRFSILDLILLNPNRTISDQYLSRLISLSISNREKDRDKLDYLSSFISNKNLIPPF